MILLGIDTCGTTGSLALARVLDEAGGDIELLGTAELAGKSTAAMLIPMLETMLREAGVLLPLVTGIVVVDGPGSFTGIRIGLASAKGLAEALAIPIYAVSRLRVLAAAVATGSAVLDAGRGEFYVRDDQGNESLLTLDEMAGALADSARLVACEPRVVAALPAAVLVAPPAAADAIRIALPEILAGRSVDVALLDGRYLRRSDLYRTSNSVPGGDLDAPTG